MVGDLQPVVSLLADCCASIAASGGGGGGGGLGDDEGDAALLQDLLEVLLLPLLRRGSLARLPLLNCLQQQGGPALLLPLMELRQPQLRLLGLRALTACLPDEHTSSVSGVTGTSVSTSSKWRAAAASPAAQLSDLGQPGTSQVLSAAGRALARFPLCEATLSALCETMCDGATWHQIDNLVPSGVPAVQPPLDSDEATVAQAASHLRIRHPAAAAALLQLAVAAGAVRSDAAAGGGGGGSYVERGAALGALAALCSNASLAKQAQQGNQDMLLAAPCCWQQLLLDCIRASGSAPSAAELAAARSAWRLLVALLARGVAASSAGAQHLHTLVCLLMAHPDRSFYCAPLSSGISGGFSCAAVPSWQLLQELLASVVLRLLAMQGTDGGGSAAAAASPSGGAGLGHTSTGGEWDAWTMISQVS